MPLLSRRRKAPSSRFSRTVMREKHLRPSGDWQMPRRTISCGGRNEISSSARRIEPVRGGVRPETERRVVDLPAPLEPIRVTHSPSSTFSETPFSAWMLP